MTCNCHAQQQATSKYPRYWVSRDKGDDMLFYVQIGDSWSDIYGMRMNGTLIRASHSGCTEITGMEAWTLLVRTRTSMQYGRPTNQPTNQPTN